MGVSVRLPVDCVWNGRSNLEAGMDIYYWEHTRFWLISSSQNDPIFGTPISPSRVVNWRPHFSKPIGSPDLDSSCTLRYES